MAFRPRYPKFDSEWAVCRVCGQNFPVFQMRYHKRQGWVCVENNWLGTFGCWGGRYRDEYRYIPRPFEGVRKSTAPLVDEDAGIVAGDAIPSMLLRDRATNEVYRVSFGTEITFVLEPTLQATRSAIPLNLGWALYIWNGEMIREKWRVPREERARLPDSVQLYVDGDSLIHVPTYPV